MIKCIHNRELRRSGPIYILQEIPNCQLCTVVRTILHNLASICFKDRNCNYPNPGTHPHMGPHVWPDLQCEFHATPLPFSCTPSTGTEQFQSKNQLLPDFSWTPSSSKQLGKITWSSVKTTNGPYLESLSWAELPSLASAHQHHKTFLE